MGLEPRKARGLEILFWQSLEYRGKLKSQVCIKLPGKNVLCRCRREVREGSGRKRVIEIEEPEKS